VKRRIFKISAALFLLFFILLGFSSRGITHTIFNKIQQQYHLLVSKNMETIETEHFIIRHEEEEVAEVTANIAEKYYKKLREKFNYHTEDKIPIIVYSDMDKMKKTAALKAESTPMGLYSGSTIRILSPEQWIDPEENMKEIFEKEGPIIHELVHYIVDDITKGNHQEWFFEGMSLYTEYLYTGFVIGKNREYDTLYTISELENNFRDLDQIKAYYSSFMIIKTLAEENNFEYLNNMLQYLSEGKNLKIII